ncbi:phosphate transporter (Pho88) [Elasticomyces elasticus]
MVNPQITNLVIILGMMQVSKKIPFDDPNVLNGVRALYVVSNLIIIGIYLYTKMQIDKKRGMDNTIRRSIVWIADEIQT